jgi:microcystin-dependent protein
LVGQDTTDISFDTLEETGGSKDAVVVSHSHTLYAQFADADGVGGQATTPIRTGAEAYRHYETVSGSTAVTTGESGTNKNLQPYIVVKMWKRVS